MADVVSPLQGTVVSVEVAAGDEVAAIFKASSVLLAVV